MNIIDRAIATVAPQAAFKRERARFALSVIKNTGYSNYGASRTKKTMIGWRSRGGSAKEDIADNLNDLREKSRDLYMGGAPLATGAIGTMRTNVVGSGLRLKSQIDYNVLNITEEQALDLENLIQHEFALWAETEVCDIERIDNFYELQQLAFMNWLLSGDVFVLLPSNKLPNSPYDLRIRLIEADRVCNPDFTADSDKIQSGVERNASGEVVAYHIRNTHPLSFSVGQLPEWARIAAFGKRTGRRNVLHIMNRWRIGQLRGVPFVSSVIETIKQLGRYTQAEVDAAVIQAIFTVFIQSDAPTNEAPFGAVIPESEQADAGDSNSIELGNALIAELAPGEKANLVEPTRPNSNFDGFVLAICRQIGVALGIPYELLVLNFTSSYSASRGALLEAWKMFKMYRSWLAMDFCQPIYEEWLSEAVSKGRIPAPGFFSSPIIRRAYCGAEWNGPAQGQLDPKKEVEAAELRVRGGFSTRSREAMELNGTDFNNNIRQLRQEGKMMKEVSGGEKQDIQPSELDKASPGDTDTE
ncbi:phage portal protein [Clostridia bacterium]|nr:phage portal protein [Clostridia bacterium]